MAEALTNVAKYAQASVASVRVMRDNEHALVEIVATASAELIRAAEAESGDSPFASRHSTATSI